ncbi:MAG TPA: hypothetical protein VIH99_00365 [Bdellovibrionota bacterium]|jgi:hypothetical protein
MNPSTTARLYFLFALLMLSIAWRICETAADNLQMHAMQIEQTLGANDIE